jgi:hypothetical protein
MNNIIEQALINLAKSSDMPSNGTWGIELLCSIWSAKELYDKAREKNKTDIIKYSMKGEYSKVRDSQALLDAMPKPLQYLILRLEEEMPILQGTKDIKVLGELRHPEATNIKEVLLMPDLVEYEFVSLETTGKMTKNINGDETHIIKMSLTRSMLDVKEKTYDSWGKKQENEKVWVTNIPFKLKQVIGGIMGREKVSLNKLKGLMSETEIEQLEAGTLHAVA